jgi:hypothetical protein
VLRSCHSAPHLNDNSRLDNSRLWNRHAIAAERLGNVTLAIGPENLNNIASIWRILDRLFSHKCVLARSWTNWSCVSNAWSSWCCLRWLYIMFVDHQTLTL